MRPMYKLVYGIAGYSNAISAARNLNLPAQIIEASYGYLGKQEYMLNDLVAALETGKRKVEEELKKLNRLKEEAKKRVRLLKEGRDAYLKKVEESCLSKVRDLEAEINEIHREIEKREKAQVKAARERFKPLKGRFVKAADESPETPSQELRAGDYVMVRTLGSKGYVVQIEREGETCEVQIGNIRTRVHKRHIERVGIEKRPAYDRGVQVHVEPVKTAEVNLIGMRVEEALAELDRFIDRAVVQGMTSVRILHGVGTGKLMSAVKEHLHEAVYIKELKRDERNAGVTVVELS